MLAYQNDTIAALATPPGRGGIAIVRVSGENARAYFEALFRPAGRQQVESHRLLYGHLYDADGAMLDECMAVLMLAPRTYTREDVAEFHLHGGDQIAREALAAVIQAFFEKTDTVLFTGGHYAYNTISGELMKKLGLAYEGIEHKAMRHAERGPTDLVCYYLEK